MKIHLIQLKNVSILEQLRLEEALLRVDDRNWCIVNHGSSPAIVMGISGKMEMLVDSVSFARAPIPVIRRFSGGGTVIVDSDTCFVTWICNAEDVDVACCPQKIHCWTSGFYREALPQVGICLNENDYVIGDRKCGGNAQYLCKGRWLHHSSLLWDYREENMHYLSMPSKVPAYRQGREHSDFLCRLRDHVAEKEILMQSVVNTLHRRFDVELLTLGEIQDIVEHPHRQATVVIA